MAQFFAAARLIASIQVQILFQQVTDRSSILGMRG
jgi:hypothetical protein